MVDDMLCALRRLHPDEVVALGLPNSFYAHPNQCVIVDGRTFKYQWTKLTPSLIRSSWVYRWVEAVAAASAGEGDMAQ